MLVNTGNTHWCLLVVNLCDGSFELRDSLKSAGGDWYDQVDRERLQAFVKACSLETSDVNVSIAEVLQQKSKTNCGVFMLEFIWAFLND
jgi:Ulp1 family protease